MGKSTRTVHVMITGRVQGVWFRGWTKEQANARVLDGWVRNRRDGRVEAVFSGRAESVAGMLKACAEGPRNAVVTDVEIVQEGGETSAGFTVRPTQ